MGPVHFYNCKFKEKTSNNYSASDNMGSGPLALVITIPTVPTGINRFLEWQPAASHWPLTLTIDIDHWLVEHCNNDCVCLSII